MQVADAINATIAIGIMGILLIVALRWGNKSLEAGRGIAGWTVFAIILVWYAILAKM